MSLGEESRAGCEVAALCSQAEPSAGGGAEREPGCAAGGAGQSLGARRRMGGVGGWCKQVTQTQRLSPRHRVKEGGASSCQVLPNSLCVSLVLWHIQHLPVLSGGQVRLGGPDFTKAAEAGGRPLASPVSPAA